ncbi:hypothetical protein AGLY_010591 [Aphis glycines]|uniref:Uncharacterized protein n=1 Tax=Aphis glycines TaxID=307491 RepID=A0A6G0TE64_APHGL|nr:hypothetical protein AGLY_010591 [Aphis glycines]
MKYVFHYFELKNPFLHTFKIVGLRTLEFIHLITKNYWLSLKKKIKTLQHSGFQNVKRETVGEKNAIICRRKEETILSFLIEKRTWAKRGRLFLGERNIKNILSFLCNLIKNRKVVSKKKPKFRGGAKLDLFHFHTKALVVTSPSLVFNIKRESLPITVVIVRSASAKTVPIKLKKLKVMSDYEIDTHIRHQIWEMLLKIVEKFKFFIDIKNNMRNTMFTSYGQNQKLRTSCGHPSKNRWYHWITDALTRLLFCINTVTWVCVRFKPRCYLTVLCGSTDTFVDNVWSTFIVYKSTTTLLA